MASRMPPDPGIVVGGTGGIVAFSPLQPNIPLAHCSGRMPYLAAVSQQATASIGPLAGVRQIVIVCP